jgi:anti-sigma regulatory factor (Ser/Thr protein kinase)
MTHGAGYVHEAAFYDGDEQLLALIVPFFTEGIRSGQPVISALAPGNQRRIHDVFGDSGVLYLGGDSQYRSPAAAIRAYQELFSRHTAEGARRIRVAGEIPGAGDGEPWDGWARYEAAVNHAYREFPVWALCCYDVRATSPQVLDDVRRTHSHVAVDGTPATNPAFVDPAAFLLSRSDAWRDPIENTRPAVELLNPVPAQAREAATMLAAAGELSDEERSGLLLAVSEAVSNAIMHGRPPLVVRAWPVPGRVVVTVTDTGAGPADPYAGLLPVPGGPGGVGLWISHQVCTYAGFQRGPDGFTLRLVIGERAG